MNLSQTSMFYNVVDEHCEIQSQHTDANVFGDVQSDDVHVSFATVYIEETTNGTVDLCSVRAHLAHITSVFIRDHFKIP